MYEYKFVTESHFYGSGTKIDGDKKLMLVDVLRKLSGEGWELIHVVSIGADEIRYIFKRQIK